MRITEIDERLNQLRKKKARLDKLKSEIKAEVKELRPYLTCVNSCHSPMALCTRKFSLTILQRTITQEFINIRRKK